MTLTAISAPGIQRDGDEKDTVTTRLVSEDLAKRTVALGFLLLGIVVAARTRAFGSPSECDRAISGDRRMCSTYPVPI